MEDCFIDTFLDPHCNSIFRALYLCFFDGKFSARGCLGTHQLLFCLPFWLIDHSIQGYQLIYNFKMLTHSFQFSFWSSSHRTCFHCSLVYKTGVSFLEIPNWRVCQRSICNTSSLPLLLGFWLGVLVPVKAPYMGQIKLLNHLLYLKPFNYV